MSARPKPQPQGACFACDAMWREYSHALAEHLKLQLDLYMATTRRDRQRESTLNQSLIAAIGRRDAAREAISRHEDKEHEVLTGPIQP